MIGGKANYGIILPITILDCIFSCCARNAHILIPYLGFEETYLQNYYMNLYSMIYEMQPQTQNYIFLNVNHPGLQVFTAVLLDNN